MRLVHGLVIRSLNRPQEKGQGPSSLQFRPVASQCPSHFPPRPCIQPPRLSVRNLGCDVLQAMIDDQQGPSPRSSASIHAGGRPRRFGDQPPALCGRRGCFRSRPSRSDQLRSAVMYLLLFHEHGGHGMNCVPRGQSYVAIPPSLDPQRLSLVRLHQRCGRQRARVYPRSLPGDDIASALMAMPSMRSMESRACSLSPGSDGPQRSNPGMDSSLMGLINCLNGEGRTFPCSHGANPSIGLVVLINYLIEQHVIKHP